MARQVGLWAQREKTHLRRIRFEAKEQGEVSCRSPAQAVFFIKLASLTWAAEPATGREEL
jgi:hypothetical protein